MKPINHTKSEITMQELSMNSRSAIPFIDYSIDDNTQPITLVGIKIRNIYSHKAKRG